MDQSARKSLEDALYGLVLEYAESSDASVQDAVGLLQEAVNRLRKPEPEPPAK